MRRTRAERRNEQWMRARVRVRFTLPTLLAGSFGSAALPTPASAMEGLFPYLPGITIGVPVGTLPPPGVYFSDTLYLFNGQIKNGAGAAVAGASGGTDVPVFVYNPDVKLLGATYGFLIATPFSAAQVRPLGGGQINGSGLVNPYVEPIDLSWRLRADLFVSAGVGVYLPVGSYSPAAPLNAGNNFTTFEPTLGITYRKDGWETSTSFRLDFNTANPADDYHSGDDFFVDSALEKTIDKWNFGLGGYVADQFTDDTIDGALVAASPGNGLGRKAFVAGVGPILGYSFGRTSIALKYEHPVAGRNYSAGDDVFLSFSALLD